jgi:hypothetical protein
VKWGGDGTTTGAGASLSLLATVEVGGPAGIGTGNQCAWDGLPGVPRSGQGSYTNLPGDARRLHAPSPVRESTVPTFTFQGQAGEQVRLLVGLAPGYTFAPFQSGVLLVGDPFQVLNMGVVPASGTLTVPFPVGALGTTPSRLLFLQARFTNAQGTKLSGPAALLELNQIY